MTEKMYCGLDIGSQKIKAALMMVKEPKQMEFIGAYENKTYGFRDGAVSDLGELSECIHITMQELLKRTSVNIKEVQMGVSGDLIDIRKTNTAIPLVDRGSKVISRRDLKKVNHQARLLGVKMEEEILHDLPQSYLIDDINFANNPQGLYGRKLGVSTLMIISGTNRVKNLIKAVNEAGFDVSNLFFSSYASSSVILSKQEKNEGCVLVDIGSRSTCILIFYDGILKYIEKVCFGGDDMTESISEQLNLSSNLAEEIKKSYAMAFAPDEHREEEILVKKESQYIPIKKVEIYRAIEPQIVKLIEMIRMSLSRSGYLHQIKHGITMIGGGSLLSGLIEKVHVDVGLPVKLCKLNIKSEINFGTSSIFSASVGLARSGFRKTFGYTVSSNGQSDWGRRIVNRIRDIYQEYF